MRGVDTNILIYAEVPGSPFYQTARSQLTRLSEGSEPWAIPWPCAYEFLRAATHPRFYKPPMPLGKALQVLRFLRESPSLVFLSETARHWDIVDALLRESGVTGNVIFDAHIAALCIEHRVSEFLTGDADFRRFPGIKVVNPFK